MEYNSPLTIHNLPLAPTHIKVIIKASVLETLGILGTLVILLHQIEIVLKDSKGFAYATQSF